MTTTTNAPTGAARAALAAKHTTMTPTEIAAHALDLATLTEAATGTALSFRQATVALVANLELVERLRADGRKRDARTLLAGTVADARTFVAESAPFHEFFNPVEGGAH